MDRLGVEAFLTETLEELEGIPEELRARLIELLGLSQAARVREFERAFEEFADG